MKPTFLYVTSTITIPGSLSDIGIDQNILRSGQLTTDSSQLRQFQWKHSKEE